METTASYGLKKPSDQDFYNIQDQNDNMDAIEAALDGLYLGKADLDPETGKVPEGQLPPSDYEERLAGAPVKETPDEADGLVLVDGTEGKARRLLWSRVRSALKGWFDALYAAAGHTHTAEEVGARPDTWKPAAADILDLAGTDYSVSRVRGISVGTADLTAGTSNLESGTIYLVYE